MFPHTYDAQPSNHLCFDFVLKLVHEDLEATESESDVMKLTLAIEKVGSKETLGGKEGHYKVILNGKQSTTITAAFAANNFLLFRGRHSFAVFHCLIEVYRA